MSIVRVKNKTYGPGLLDIQIEQGADFALLVTLTRTVGMVTGPWDLTLATIDAHMSSEWSPGGACVLFTISPVDLVNGEFQIIFPAAGSLALPFQPLPHQPRKTITPEVFTLGGWVLNITDGTTARILEGTVYLDRDPCLT